MRQFLLRGLLVVSTTGTATAHAGGPGLFHHLCRHHACACAECSQRPIVIHCCPTGGSESDRAPESGRQPESSTISAPLIQATAPQFGYGYPQFAMPQMAVMPYPVAAQTGGYQLPESQQQKQRDCSDQLRRLEDDVRQLTRDVDRIVDVVDRHSRVLDRLTEVLSADSEFMKRVEATRQASPTAPAADGVLPSPPAPSGESSQFRSSYRLTR